MIVVMEKRDDAIRDVVGIGNAIVDILAFADQAFLTRNNLVKGSMLLVDVERAVAIYEAMKPVLELPGGSVSNTMAGIASLGGTGSYIGKVHKDKLGEVFREGLESIGIGFTTTPSLYDVQTARCLVIVTPDGQRSMATYLGACAELGPDDVEAEIISGHRLTYLEGYLWDAPMAKEAVIKAAKLAHRYGCQVALTLSDSLCVDRHRESFRNFIQNHVDILFANEEEITSLYETDKIDVAVELGRQECNLLVVTLGAQGSLIASGDNLSKLDSIPVSQVVDTTGAGDLYAAGFLFGITHGYDPVVSGRMGAVAAAEIISHVGARPEESLSKLITSPFD
jgi:sugar/nucleoside kinase (ribokinase family)